MREQESESPLSPPIDEPIDESSALDYSSIQDPELRVYLEDKVGALMEAVDIYPIDARSLVTLLAPLAGLQSHQEKKAFSVLQTDSLLTNLLTRQRVRDKATYVIEKENVPLTAVALKVMVPHFPIDSNGRFKLSGLTEDIADAVEGTPLKKTYDGLHDQSAAKAAVQMAKVGKNIAVFQNSEAHIDVSGIEEEKNDPLEKVRAAATRYEKELEDIAAEIDETKLWRLSAGIKQLSSGDLDVLSMQRLQPLLTELGLDSRIFMLFQRIQGVLTSDDSIYYGEEPLTYHAARTISGQSATALANNPELQHFGQVYSRFAQAYEERQRRMGTKGRDIQYSKEDLEPLE